EDEPDQLVEQNTQVDFQNPMLIERFAGRASQAAAKANPPPEEEEEATKTQVDFVSTRAILAAQPTPRRDESVVDDIPTLAVERGPVQPSVASHVAPAAAPNADHDGPERQTLADAARLPSHADEEDEPSITREADTRVKRPSSGDDGGPEDLSTVTTKAP